MQGSVFAGFGVASVQGSLLSLFLSLSQRRRRLTVLIKSSQGKKGKALRRSGIEDVDGEENQKKKRKLTEKNHNNTGMVVEGAPRAGPDFDNWRREQMQH